MAHTYKGTAYFAVLDGPDPSVWTPWGSSISDFRSCVKSVRTPAVPAQVQFDVAFDLVIDNQDALLNRNNWFGVVGAVVDLKSTNADIRAIHAKVCHKIASAASLSSNVGYYIVFVTGGAPTPADEQLMIDFERDAAAALAFGSTVPVISFEASSFESLALALRQFERQMRKTPPRAI